MKLGMLTYLKGASDDAGCGKFGLVFTTTSGIYTAKGGSQWRLATVRSGEAGIIELSAPDGAKTMFDVEDILVVRMSGS